MGHGLGRVFVIIAAAVFAFIDGKIYSTNNIVMKKTLVLLIMLSMMMSAFSQAKLDYSAKPKSEAIGQSAKGLSAASARFLWQLRQAEAVTDRSVKTSLYAQLEHEYDLMQGKVSAVIVLASGKTPQDLSAYDVTVNSVSGEMVTAMIPVGRFEELTASGVCAIIDVGEKHQPTMDKARVNLGIDQIHEGTYLPQGYDGSGVIVGIIDGGIEFCHPAFYDSTGTTLRVKRVWNQKDNTGVAPDGFSYGSEYLTEAQMMAAGADDTLLSHGSHTASIAAGCGAPHGDGTAYKGIAPGADLVFVSSTLQTSHIIDALNYIHSYAQSVGKPCVINMSFGSQVGPHDGTSIKDRFVTSLVEQNPDSLVIVASASNEGSSPIHLEKQFTPEDTLLTTAMVYDLLQTNNNGTVDIWGDENFSVALTLLNNDTHAQVDFTGFLSTGTDTSFVTYLLTDNNDTLLCYFNLNQMDSYNHRYNATIQIGRIPIPHQVILTVRCNTVATVHAWATKILLKSTSLVEGSMTGDSQYTIGGFGANSDAVISVGAYCTRLSYTTYKGIFQQASSSYELGNIAPFSSMGPTCDGRVKPDITAPGSVIAAACNRYDIYEGGLVGAYDTIMWNGQIEKYIAISGTSMSAPMVTGIVALWLQHNPSLGIDSVRAILHRTAHNDRYTGNCITEPSNVWGHGKVNAYGGLPVNTAVWLLNAFEAQDGSGCVDGGGMVSEGSHALTAVPAHNYVFLSWEDGNTDNPRTVNVTCDTTFIAVFAPIAYDECDTISDFPWSPEFDDDLTCWKLIDADGDGDCWKRTSNIISYKLGAGASQLNNWLVSPAIQVNQRLKVNLAGRFLNIASSQQECSLLLSTSGSEVADFTTVLDSYLCTDDAGDEFSFSVPLDEFQGQTVRLAVQHHNCTMIAFLTLSDLRIDINTDPVSVPSHTETSDYTIATNGRQFNISGAEGHSLRIYDLTGRLILSSQTANGSYVMPSSGVYILCVNGLKPRKVVVTR